MKQYQDIHETVFDIRHNVYGRDPCSILVMFHPTDCFFQSDSSNLGFDCESSFSANLIDTEAIAMLALHKDFELSNQNISFFTNRINLLLTKFHTRQISSVLVYFTNIQNLSLTPERSDKNAGRQPRLSLLSGISIASVEISIPFLNISPVNGKKAADFVGLDQFLVNEILLEEALTDLLSQVACFELMSPSKELIESLIHLRVNRISSLGLKLESAQSCVNSAIDSFFQRIHTTEIVTI